MTYKDDIITKQPRTVTYTSTLRCVTNLPKGVKFDVTSTPHRNNPDLDFYEAWFTWRGGSLRTASAIFDAEARVSLLVFLRSLTGVDHTDEVEKVLDQLDWANE